MNHNDINLKTLSRKVVKKTLKAGIDLDSIWLERETNWESVEFLDGSVLGQLQDIHRVLAEVVPNDFDFTLSFSENGCMLMLSYHDGPTRSCGHGVGSTYKSLDSLATEMKSQDWDEQRVDSIQGSQIWDIFLAEADKNEPSVRTVSEVQNDHLELVGELKAKEEKNGGTWAVYAFGGMFAELVHEACPDYKNVIGAIGDLMVTGHEVLAVFREGMLLSHEEIEKLKKTTLENLGPISRAKAEGRMP